MYGEPQTPRGLTTQSTERTPLDALRDCARDVADHAEQHAGRTEQRVHHIVGPGTEPSSTPCLPPQPVSEVIITQLGDCLERIRRALAHVDNEITRL